MAAYIDIIKIVFTIGLTNCILISARRAPKFLTSTLVLSGFAGLKLKSCALSPSCFACGRKIGTFEFYAIYGAVIDKAGVSVARRCYLKQFFEFTPLLDDLYGVVVNELEGRVCRCTGIAEG